MRPHQPRRQRLRMARRRHILDTCLLQQMAPHRHHLQPQNTNPNSPNRRQQRQPTHQTIPPKSQIINYTQLLKDKKVPTKKSNKYLKTYNKPKTPISNPQTCMTPKQTLKPTFYKSPSQPHKTTIYNAPLSIFQKTCIFAKTYESKK